MGRIAIFYIIESQQYVSRAGIEAYLTENPTHTMMEVIADESVLTTSGSRLPPVKSYLRENIGEPLKTITYSGSGIFVNTIGNTVRSITNKRDLTVQFTTSSNTYVAASSMYYMGYNNEGVPTKITAIVSVTIAGNNTGFVRLYDVTNNVVLGEVEVTQPGKRAIDLQNLESFSSDPCVIEAQIRNSHGSLTRTITMYNLTLSY